MKLYKFDISTGAYMCWVDVPDDDLHLYDEGYTTTDPAGRNRWNVIAHDWETVADHRGQDFHDPVTNDQVTILLLGEVPPTGWAPGPAPGPTLTVARRAAWSRIKAARTAQEFGPFTWGGHVFDGTVDAQRRLAMAEQGAQRALAAGLTPSIDWTVADNTAVTLSAQDVLEVFAAMTDNIRAAHDKARTLRAQIDAAITITELESIQWA